MWYCGDKSLGFLPVASRHNLGIWTISLELPPDPAHLLVPPVRMHFRLEPHAVGHGLRDGAAAFDGALGGSENGADGDFAAFEEAGAEHPGGGEAEAVAGGAERGGHGADEADPAEGVSAGEAED